WAQGPGGHDELTVLGVIPRRLGAAGRLGGADHGHEPDRGEQRTQPHAKSPPTAHRTIRRRPHEALPRKRRASRARPRPVTTAATASASGPGTVAPVPGSGLGPGASGSVPVLISSPTPSATRRSEARAAAASPSMVTVTRYQAPPASVEPSGAS